MPTDKNDILNYFTKFDQIINELQVSEVIAVEDEQFLVAILLRSMNSKFQNTVIAIAMSTKNVLKLEMVKTNLRNHSLTVTEETRVTFMQLQSENHSLPQSVGQFQRRSSRRSYHRDSFYSQR